MANTDLPNNSVYDFDAGNDAPNVGTSGITTSGTTFTYVADATLGTRAIQWNSTSTVAVAELTNVPSDCTHIEVETRFPITGDGRPGLMFFQDGGNVHSGIWAQYDNRIDNRWEILDRSNSVTQATTNGTVAPTTTDFRWKFVCTREWETIGSAYRTRLTIYSWSGTAWVLHLTHTSTNHTSGGLAIYSSSGLSATTMGPVNAKFVSPSKNECDIYLIAGQSNAAGRDTRLASDVYDYRCGAMNQSSEVLPAFNPLQHANMGGDTLGFSQGFFDAVKGALTAGRSVLFVPAAFGGTGFFDNRWNPGDDLYNNAVSLTNEAIALNGANALRAILWHQGEDARTSTSNAADHATRLNAMINAMRTALGVSTPFLAGGFTSEAKLGGTSTENANMVTIENGIIGVMAAQARAAFVSAVGLTSKAGDSIHFDRDSLIAIGGRYSTALSSILAGGTLTQSDIDSIASAVVALMNADATQLAARTAAISAASQTTKAEIRSYLNGRWTDEIGGNFDLTITDTP